MYFGEAGLFIHDAATTLTAEIFWLPPSAYIVEVIQVVLYEDELDDNGISLLTAKVVCSR